MRSKKQKGYSIAELMIGLALGLILVAGVSAVFVQTTADQKAFAQNSEQIENGRQAVEVLSQALRMAGYYNSFYSIPTPNGVNYPTDYPDPCETASASNLYEALAFYVEPRAANGSKPSFSSSSCVGSVLAASNLVSNSDVIVVRRFSTNEITTGTAVDIGRWYAQTNAFAAELSLPTAAVAVTDSSLCNATTGEPHINGAIGSGLDGCKRPTGVSVTSVPSSSATFRASGVPMVERGSNGYYTPGRIMPLITEVYFVAPCANGLGTDGACSGGSTEDTIPTLKKIKLDSSGGAPVMVLEPLVEGVEMIRFDWGLDTLPTTTNESTGLQGDGAPDSWVNDLTAFSQAQQIVSARIKVLARNRNVTPGYSDTKTYDLGLSGTVGPFTGNDALFKRHVYSAEVRIENAASQREAP